MDRIAGEGAVQFGHEFHDGGALADGLEELAGIAFGLGLLGNAPDHGQKFIKDEEIAFLQQIMKTVLGHSHFFQQVLLVAMQGRLAELVLGAQLGQGSGPVQQGQVDGPPLGVVADRT